MAKAVTRIMSLSLEGHTLELLVAGHFKEPDCLLSVCMLEGCRGSPLSKNVLWGPRKNVNARY